MALVAMETFFRELRRINVLGGETAAADLRRIFSAPKTTITAFDEALKTVRITGRAGEELRIADETLGHVYTKFRTGDLAEVFRTLKLDSSSFSSMDAANFRAAVGKTPESEIHALEQATARNAARYSNVDTKTLNNQVLKYFRTGTVISLTVGTIVIGVSSFELAMKASTGCMMVTVIGSNTTSCRISQLSCTNLDLTEGLCTNHVELGRNYTLLIMSVANMPNDRDVKIQVAQELNITPAELYDKIPNLIDSRFDEIRRVMDKVITATGYTVSEPCRVKHKEIEGGIVPECRMCTPSAPVKSTEYIDLSNFGNNITFVCTPHPSPIKIATDLIRTTGIDILKGLSSATSFLLKPIAIIVGILFALVVLAIILRAVWRSDWGRKQRQNVSGALVRRRGGGKPMLLDNGQVVYDTTPLLIDNL